MVIQLARLVIALLNQLKASTKVPEGGSGNTLTDAASLVVEQVGVVVVMALLGWWLSSVLHSVWYFIGLLTFGAFGSGARLYYKSRAELDDAVEKWHHSRNSSLGNGESKGFGNLLEGSDDIEAGQ